MTVEAVTYLRHIRALSPDEISRWRHEFDWTERLKPSRLRVVQATWETLVADRIGPGVGGRLEVS